jgi:hypothetical protein
MAKKYEFKPDKQKGNLLSRLYLTKLQRQSVLKWGLYVLCLLVLSLLQDMVLCRVKVLGATTELIPCAIFLICLLQDMEDGSVFALVASFMYLFTGSSPGMHVPVLITFLAVGAMFLRQSYLLKGFGSILLCTVGAMAVYELCVFFVSLFLQLTRPDRFVGFMITAGLSLLSVPVLYPLFAKISQIGGAAWND